MAVKLNQDAQLVFFTKVFNQTDPVIEHVKALLGIGITFEVSLYAVRAYANDGKKALEPVQLSAGTTALMKGTIDPAVATHNKKLIADWVSYLYAKQGSPKPVTFTPKPFVPKVLMSVALTGVLSGKKLHLIKAVNKALFAGGELSKANGIVQKASAGEKVVLATYDTVAEASTLAQALQSEGGIVELAKVPSPEMPVTAGIDWAKGVPLKDLNVTVHEKPVNAVIDLKNSKAIGQKVHGTSTGSVYHTIALTDHLKVAARITGGTSISLRAEWTDNPKDDLKKLQEAGVVLKGEYASVHFDAAGVPVQRVIGAFLMGTGINWKSVITAGSELVVG